MDLTAKLLLSAVDAARLISVGRSHFYALHSSGRLGPRPIRLGRRTLWNRKELESWVAAGCPAREKWLQTNGMKKVEKSRVC
ncbi:MAG: helix-turn-helix domain-containing protein [Planctomycetes bacterium]|nr:helix-turn-helix domain-containing protein [Planctomycetota bacterium]